jgi:PhnB protein
MKAFQPYLNFDGNTRDAMTFYQKCTGGELKIQTFGDVKAPGPPGSENRVMHAHLQKGSAVLMASDTMPGMPFTQGNNIWVNIDCDGVPEIEALFKAFSEGGKVIMPLADQFWGARFGMLTDKFGINWMFNCELPKKN